MGYSLGLLYNPLDPNLLLTSNGTSMYLCMSRAAGFNFKPYSTLNYHMSFVLNF